jgi:hypothetical protein
METIKSVYFAYFHSLIRYSNIFWGNSTNKNKLFLLQKRIIKIMGICMRCSFSGLFKNINILPFLVNIFFLLIFAIKNFDNFQMNTDIHGINTRAKHQLRRPTGTLSCIQKDLFYSGIKIFDRLPPQILKLKNEPARFRVAMNKYLLIHPFYSVDEFLSTSQAALPLKHQQL